jgi:hypothetical protein
MPHRLHQSKRVQAQIKQLTAEAERHKAVLQLLVADNQRYRLELGCFTACLEGLEALRLRLTGSRNAEPECYASIHAGVSDDASQQCFQDAQLLAYVPGQPAAQDCEGAAADALNGVNNTTESVKGNVMEDNGSRKPKGSGGSDSSRSSSKTCREGSAGDDGCNGRQRHFEMLGSREDPMSYFRKLLRTSDAREEAAPFTLEALLRRYADTVSEMAVQLHLLERPTDLSDDGPCPAENLWHVVDRCVASPMAQAVAPTPASVLASA